MLRRFGLVLVALLIAFPVCAAQQHPTEAEKSFMWRVQRDGTTVYILGSIHALREDAYPLPAVIEEAFEEAEVVAFEVDLDDMTAAAVTMLAAGTLEGERTLEEVIGPEAWNDVSERLRGAGLQPEAFQRMKPWMVALTLTAFELVGAGYSPGAGLDSHFSNRAKAAGKERLALETVDFQVGLFADLTPAQSEAFLHYTLSDLDTVIPLLDELSAQWRVGNVEPVEKLLVEGFEEFPVLFRKMVTDRNRSWLAPVEELIAGDRDAMVVVGALHLVGDGGLVALLRERGYTVEQL